MNAVEWLKVIDCDRARHSADKIRPNSGIYTETPHPIRDYRSIPSRYSISPWWRTYRVPGSYIASLFEEASDRNAPVFRLVTNHAHRKLPERTVGCWHLRSERNFISDQDESACAFPVIERKALPLVFVPLIKKTTVGNRKKRYRYARSLLERRRERG